MTAVPDAPPFVLRCSVPPCETVSSVLSVALPATSSKVLSSPWWLLFLFAALASAHTWPLMSAPGSWSRNDNADAMLNEWILAWVARTLPTDPLNLFNANIFYPEANTLAFSESLIVQGTMAIPFYWLGASPVLTMNVLIVVGLTLTAWSMSSVIERWTGDRLAGVLAGSLAAFNAYTLTHMGHVQAMHVEFLPIAFLALDNLLREARASHAVKLALWFTLQALTSGYLMVMSLVGLSMGLLARTRELVSAAPRRTLGPFVLAALLASVLCAPFVWPYYRVRTEHGLVRTSEEVAMYSASLRNYLFAGSRLHYGSWSQRFAADGDALFPGFVALALTGIAIAQGVALRDRRARMLLAAGGAGFLLSFGPRLSIYEWLHQYVPIFQGLRGASRFGYLALFAIAGLASFGLRALRTKGSARFGSRATTTAALALIVLAQVEACRAPMRFTRFAGIPAAYGVLAQEPNAVVAEFPFPLPRAIIRNGTYVLSSTRHWKPLLNGYSGFFPASYEAHAEAFQSFPQPPSFEAMRRAGVTHVVTHPIPQDPELTRVLDARADLQLIAEGPGIRIYRFR